MSGDGTDFEVLHGTLIVERMTKIDQIISEPKVIKLHPKRRKCLFASEPQSKYFDVTVRTFIGDDKMNFFA